MKTCQNCKIDKDESEFPIRKDRSNKLRPYCNTCANDIVRSRYSYHRVSNPFLHKCTRARSRSQSLKVPFNLTPEYLESIWTGICPVSGVEISLIDSDRSKDNVAELDRFIPDKGYVKGNVTFLSRRINRLKSCSTVKELESILNWMKNHEDQ
jgi:hypothetical protein